MRITRSLPNRPRKSAGGSQVAQKPAPTQLDSDSVELTKTSASSAPSLVDHGKAAANTAGAMVGGPLGEPLRLILAGPPGSGKGTQSRFIQEKWGGTHLSTGAMLREEVSQGTDLGKEAKQYMDKGELVPDDLILSMVRGRIENEDSFILDGFPRSVPQAEGLDEMLAELNKPLTSAVLLDVGDEVIVKRLLARGREDDKEHIIRNRLKVYHDQTAPMIAHFRKQGLVETVPVAGTIEANRELVMARVGARVEGQVPSLAADIPSKVLQQVETTPGYAVEKLIQDMEGLVAEQKAPYAASWTSEQREDLTDRSKEFLEKAVAARPGLTLPELTEACKLHTEAEALAVDTSAKHAKYGKIAALLATPVLGFGLFQGNPLATALGGVALAGGLLLSHQSEKSGPVHQARAKALGGTRDLFEGWSVKLSDEQ